jgi:hypothetical protein
MYIYDEIYDNKAISLQLQCGTDILQNVVRKTFYIASTHRFIQQTTSEASQLNLCACMLTSYRIYIYIYVCIYIYIYIYIYI